MLFACRHAKTDNVYDPLYGSFVGEVEEDTAALALLLKHKFLDGGADDVALTLATLGERSTARAPPVQAGYVTRPTTTTWASPAPSSARLHFGAFGLVGRTCTACRSGPHSVTDLLADLLALTGLATLEGCDQLLRNDCTDVFATGGRRRGAALTLSITGAASVGLLSSATESRAAR